MIEKSTPTIQNVERTHGTIQPSIPFFPSIPSILNESLSFQPTAYPFPLSNHHFTAFTPFHTNTILLYPFHCISIHIHSNPSTTPPPSTHSHTTATTQFRSNTHNPFCVELGTPNINNSRKLLDLCVCLFKAHTFFYSTCLVSLTSTSRILLVSCSARAKSPNCLISFQRTRLCT